MLIWTVITQIVLVDDETLYINYFYFDKIKRNCEYIFPNNIIP